MDASVNQASQTHGISGAAALTCAAVLVAAPASGQGKTTVAAALARLHARQGRRVRAFKCGPDFLDPHWLALATGAPVHSLDLWMTGEADCRARLRAAAAECDLLIVEGVMGLFDGTPSAADLAERFGLPVLAVIDAHAMAGTFGALAYGLQNFRPGLPWAGVLANRVASERHAGMLKDALREPAQWMGALPRDAGFTLPERHLGLVLATELGDAMARLDAVADVLADTPLGRLRTSQLPQASFGAPEPQPENEGAHAVPPLLAGRTIAIARDAAFSFIYPANLDVLVSLGARLSFFSPLAGDGLPACDAVWLPGGYPELHAEALSACVPLREALAAHAAAGKPVWAECGGMMALFDELATPNGARAHRMWGLLPGKVTMQKRLAGLGPQQLTLGAHTLRGHTFHYSLCDTPLAPVAHTARPGLTQAVGARGGEALYVHGPVRASYFHAWFASSPEATARLFSAMPIELERHASVE
ncbi:cobyrinate a,c-diamide synthase [Variovorax sp. J22G73]|uniref:cobyrinate a,c-diamide synthase n=1 Tax=unclassified Variovorax TaxID=663243 RepID=UPI000D5D1CBC|nr:MULTISPECIES: cobyrinate a,c-diamide synthase [unclassified Variovorax]MDM0003367.1 cobyrinate a,c-diamide synthase [Variovorax sp. J22R203]MDM0096967.1 cobyrinate a,c-diamide synthase [Variovorax sp. J22G73]